MTDAPNDGTEDENPPDWFDAAESDGSSTGEKAGFVPDGADWFDDVEPESVDIEMPDDDPDPTGRRSDAPLDDIELDAPIDTVNYPDATVDTVDTSDARGDASDATTSTAGNDPDAAVGENTDDERSTASGTRRGDSSDANAVVAPSRADISDGSTADDEDAGASSWVERLLGWARSVFSGRSE